MKSVFYYLTFLVALLLILNNYVYFFVSPVHSTANLFLVFLLVLFAVRWKKTRREEDYDGYDYDRENPNALVTGLNVAGTVYASYPGQTGGLGWVL